MNKGLTGDAQINTKFVYYLLCLKYKSELKAYFKGG